MLGTTAISLSSAWAYGEVNGWPQSLQKGMREAPGFYATYILCVAAAAAIVLIPGVPLQLIILSVQVLAGIMLPSAIIFLQLLLNEREVLGERLVNKPWNNVVNLDDCHRPVLSLSDPGGAGRRAEAVSGWVSHSTLTNIGEDQ